MEQRKTANERELEVLAHWDKHKIFKRSIEERPKKDPYVFYDGPPFATGEPHYGHILISTIKDLVARYWTMQGKRVERVWGWDCHGLPIENIVEKDLDLGTKQKIEEFGIDNFNNACRDRVLGYVDVWKKAIHRLGRWVDMENAYSTMDLNFMESVWWVFKEMHEKGALYEGYRPMHICPRCATTLSQSEVGQGYKDVTDTSVTVRFKLVDDPDTSILAWTTTPWTLPGNMLLAVGKTITYVKVKQRNEFLILAKDRLEEVMDGEYEVVEELKADDLIGKKYAPLFPYFADREEIYYVTHGDFVSTDEGTGIVHLALAFGEDDFAVGQREGIEPIRHIRMDGSVIDEVKDFAGRQAKEIEQDVVSYLTSRGLVYMAKPIRHSYPHCWRCDTPLLNYATSSWFVRVADIRDQLLANNAHVRWVPATMKEGRFGNWLRGARDWSISRQRYWGTPLPVWKADDGEMLIIGSVQELEDLSGQKVTDLHKHIIDDIVIEKDGKTYHRIPEVLDCWMESGSMPFAQLHYPFENEKQFEAGFPADFIVEAQDQTRAWFYYLLVISTWLKQKTPFLNVIVNGMVLAEDGKKMSKRLKNYPDPMKMIDQYGADAVRFYLTSSPVVHAETLRFSEKGVKEVSNKLIGMLGNVLAFYQLFVDDVPESIDEKVKHPLDHWITGRSMQLLQDVTAHTEAYELAPAARRIRDFVTDLSQWYVRRSRDRFKGDDAQDKAVASFVLHEVLERLALVMAPYAPFIAEHVYLGLGKRDEADSVHLQHWPEARELSKDEQAAIETMKSVRDLVTRTLEQRMEAKIPVRQVLGKVAVMTPEKIESEYLDVVKEEVNVQEVTWTKGEVGVELNTTITPELKRLGLVRELTRHVNALRKQAKLSIDDTVTVHWESDDGDVVAAIEEHGEVLKNNVRASELVRGDAGEDEVKLGDAAVRLLIK